MDATVRDGIFPSDHKEVICEIRSIRRASPLVTRRSAMNYRRADWDGMRASLRLIPWTVLDGMPVDDATELFYDLLNATIKDHIPLVQLKRRYPPWFDRDLRSALAEKEAAHRRMKSNRSPQSEAVFQEKRRSFKQISSNKFYDYLSGLVDDMKTNPKRFWTFLKCQKGRNSAIPYLRDGSRKVTDEAEKAELLNQAFAAKFTNPVEGAFPPAPEYALDPMSEIEVSEGIVRSVLRGVNSHKACGPDNISARVIFECSEELTVPITKLCRLSVSQGTFPGVWKRANIVPIFKKGSKTLPTNYRSVSLLPLLSKVLERVVCVSLFAHVRPVLSEKQHGFVPGRSCVSNLATMLEKAWVNVEAGSQTDVIYTDYSAAVQSVNHVLLIHKLQHSYHI